MKIKYRRGPKIDLCGRGRRGGGLSVYISNVFKSKVIRPCTLSLPTIEAIFIETVKENC